MLKEPFTMELILIMFDFIKFIMLEINISDLVLGAVISQQRLDEKKHPEAFYLQKLMVLKQSYKIYNKELLAIVDSIKHWRIYLKSPRH